MFNDNNRYKNLKDSELNELLEKYYGSSVSYLTPVGIQLVLIAFSPAVAAYIKNKLKVKNVDQLQKEIKDALDAFLKKHYCPEVYNGFTYLDEVDYVAMLTPKKDILRLLACFQNRNLHNDGHAYDFLRSCRPILERYQVTFKKLFPEEFEKQKEEFAWAIPGIKQETKNSGRQPVDFGVDLTKKSP